MNKRILIVVVLLMMAAGAGLFYSQGGGLGTQRAVSARKALYHCPMHPNFTSDRPGKCAICGMDLVKNAETDSPQEETSSSTAQKKDHKILYYRNPMNPTVTSPNPMKDSMGMDYVPVYADERASKEPGITIDAYRQQLIGVTKDMVKKRPLSVEISTVGWVAHDTDLFVAQEEYVQALKTALATQNSTLLSIRQQSQDLLKSSEQKLLHMGMSKEEVAALKTSGAAQQNLYFPTNSGKAWIYMTVYEYEAGLVNIGEDVSVDAVAFPGQVFKGKVTAITPVLNSESRSVRVRAEISDKGGQLMPEMYVNAKIFDDLGNRLAIPVDAVLTTGTRKIVFVVRGNRFVPTEPAIGIKAGDFYEVLGGLKEGEEIVTSGNFLIDSESKLQGAI